MSVSTSRFLAAIALTALTGCGGCVKDDAPPPPAKPVQQAVVSDSGDETGVPFGSRHASPTTPRFSPPNVKQ